jgi:uncharacterized membrane protein
MFNEALITLILAVISNIFLFNIQLTISGDYRARLVKMVSEFLYFFLSFCLYGVEPSMWFVLVRFLINV